MNGIPIWSENMLMHAHTHTRAHSHKHTSAHAHTHTRTPAHTLTHAHTHANHSGPNLIRYLSRLCRSLSHADMHSISLLTSCTFNSKAAHGGCSNPRDRQQGLAFGGLANVHHVQRFSTEGLLVWRRLVGPALAWCWRHLRRPQPAGRVLVCAWCTPEDLGPKPSLRDCSEQDTASAKRTPVQLPPTPAHSPAGTDGVAWPLHRRKR